MGAKKCTFQGFPSRAGLAKELAQPAGRTPILSADPERHLQVRTPLFFLPNRGVVGKVIRLEVRDVRR